MDMLDTLGSYLFVVICN